MRVFLTGAHGYLGTHVVDALLGAGHAVVADPADAAAVAILDDTHAEALEPASLDLVARTARLLDAMPARVGRIVVAASADGYGEGPGECEACGRVRPESRRAGAGAPWEPRCPRCEGVPAPVAVREDDRLQPAEPLAALRVAREDLVHAFGRTRGVETVSLRFFSIYGPGRLDGAFASIASALRCGHGPELGEDGGQTRDFVHVRDAARAVCVALEHPRAAGNVFNVGTGKPCSLAALTGLLSEAMGASVSPVLTGRARPGSARHLFADPKKIQHYTGWRPSVTLAEGIGGIAGHAPAAPTRV